MEHTLDMDIVEIERMRCEAAREAYSNCCRSLQIPELSSIMTRLDAPVDGALCMGGSACRVSEMENADETAKEAFVKQHPYTHICTDPDCQKRTEKNWFHMKTHLHLDGLSFIAAHCSIDGQQVVSLSKGLQAHGNVKSLHLNHCSLTPQCVTLLCLALAESGKTVKSIELYNNNMINQNETVLPMQLLSPMTDLTSLKLSGNKLGDVGVTALASSLQSATKLEQLFLNDCDITDAGLRAFGTCFRKSRNDPNSGLASLSVLGLRHNHITPIGAKCLAAVLSNKDDYNCNIADLQLRGNPIGDEGVHYLSSSLLSNSQLKNIELRCTELTAAAVKHLTNFDNCRYVSSLNLNDNTVGDEGVIELTSSSVATGNIKTLGLKNNSISHVGGSALCAALRSGVLKNTVGIDISSNALGDLFASELAKSLRVNRTLQSIDINNCLITNTGAVAIAAALSESTLSHLDFSHNVSDSKPWSSMIVSNSSLVRLSLMNLHLNHSQVADILSALKRNKHLMSVHLYGSSGKDANAVNQELKRHIHNRRSYVDRFKSEQHVVSKYQQQQQKCRPVFHHALCAFNRNIYFGMPPLISMGLTGESMPSLLDSISSIEVDA
eukprot:TRINITY_DN3392_c0_g2_i1.p1 TRINITY_DN3392_c0_g2~~TRINITY_DN3392_c0_g2_i1.p1  ORF type:complete len:630 (+),score=126.17 TRINITY_DN3392_c0_g2_i1:64-1890(+)